MKHTNLLTREDLDTFDRIDKDCLAMHVCPPPKTFIELSVQDGAGVEVERYTDRAHSWVRNAYNFLAAKFFQGVAGSTYAAGSLAGVRTAGPGLEQTNMNVLYTTDWTSMYDVGVVVGTSDSAESFDAYDLSSRITNGNTSGKLAHQYGVVGTPVYDAGTKKWTCAISKIFNNNSGGGITVKECGLINNLGASYLFCRDVLASPVTVPNAGQLTVTYTIEMTFPA